MVFCLAGRWGSGVWRCFFGGERLGFCLVGFKKWDLDLHTEGRGLRVLFCSVVYSRAVWVWNGLFFVVVFLLDVLLKEERWRYR